MNPKEIIRELQQKKLYRKRKLVSEHLGFPLVSIDGKPVVSFGSNNYLGLGPAVHQRVFAKMDSTDIVQQASPLIQGYTPFHQQLENKLAELKGQPSAMLFSSGFLANLMTLTTLVESEDLVIFDKDCHASLLEATKYRHVSFRTFPHANYEYLEKIVKKHTPKSGQIFIVSDTVFSMRGDTADLDALLKTAQECNAYLVLDEAHAVGVLGTGGGGLSVDHPVKKYPRLITVGTLSKALQSYGGFVAASTEIIELLINRARGYIYNTALPQIHVLAALEALKLIKTGNPQGQLAQRLDWAQEFFPRKLSRLTPIIPVPYGDNKKVLDISKALLEKGYFVPAIRYPTVPPKQAMLRISLSAAHEECQISDLARIISSG